LAVPNQTSSFAGGYWLADDPPQFGCNAIQRPAFFLHPLRVIVPVTLGTKCSCFLLAI
jgi:hypothetical protein